MAPPNSGSLDAPKTTMTMTSITINSGIPNPNIFTSDMAYI
jgi:hypothetical protein